MDTTANYCKKKNVRTDILEWTFDCMFEEMIYSFRVYPNNDSENFRFVLSRTSEETELWVHTHWNSYEKVSKICYRVFLMDSVENVLKTDFVEDDVNDQINVIYYINRISLGKLDFLPCENLISQLSIRCELYVKLKPWSFSPESDINLYNSDTYLQNALKTNHFKSLEILSENVRSSLYGDAPFSDISIKTSDKIIKAHRSLLHSRCPLLLNDLDTHLSNGAGLSPLRNVNYSTLKWILNYLYSACFDEFDNLENDPWIFDIYNFALRYELHDLSKHLAPVTMRVSSSLLLEQCHFVWSLRNVNFLRRDLYRSSHFITTTNAFVHWYLELQPLDNLLLSVSLKSVEETKSTGCCTVALIIESNSEKASLKPKSFKWCQMNSELNHSPENVTFDMNSYAQESQPCLILDAIEINCTLEVNTGTVSYTHKIEKLHPDSSDSLNMDNFSKNLRTLFESGTFSDVALRTCDGTYNVHRFILAARSATFSDLLRDQDKNVIDIEGIDDATLRILLHYLYTGEVSDWNNILELYKAAKFYKLLNLLIQCRERFIHCLKETNVCDALLLSVSLEDDELKKAAEKYILDHAPEVLLSDGGLSLIKNHKDIVSDLLKRLSSAYIKGGQASNNAKEKV